MKNLKQVLPKAAGIFILFTLICGVLYTGIVTGLAQLIFPHQANGSMIEVDGKKYGCELLGQQYTDPAHMWGRVMNVDVSTYTDAEGKIQMYASPSNLSPASEVYEQRVAERVAMLRAANPDMSDRGGPCGPCHLLRQRPRPSHFSGSGGISGETAGCRKSPERRRNPGNHPKMYGRQIFRCLRGRDR